MDEDPRDARRSPQRLAKAPWPVRRGGLAMASVPVAIAALSNGQGEVAILERKTGRRRASTLAYIGTARFWFESFQNWQSEFPSPSARCSY